MKHALTITGIAILLAVSNPGLAQDSAMKHVAARMELHPIQTMTLSDSQFLKGDAGGKPVTVSGQFRIPQGSGRLPVVVMVHGSGGIGASIDVWSKEFIEMGIATFVIDGFTGRGLTRVSNDQALLGRLNLILDAYRALDILAKHPRADAQRIALMGFSRGGPGGAVREPKKISPVLEQIGRRIRRLYPFLSRLHDDVCIRH